MGLGSRRGRFGCGSHSLLSHTSRSDKMNLRERSAQLVCMCEHVCEPLAPESHPKCLQHSLKTPAPRYNWRLSIRPTSQFEPVENVRDRKFRAPAAPASGRLRRQKRGACGAGGGAPAAPEEGRLRRQRRGAKVAYGAQGEGRLRRPPPPPPPLTTISP